MKLTFPTAGTPPKVVSDNFTIVDFYESKMSEYDSSFVFVPLRKLQELRGMIDPTTGVGQRQRRSRSSSSRAPTATRSATSCARRFRRNCTASTPGATSKARCWPPCRWKPPSSTCCCS